MGLIVSFVTGRKSFFCFDFHFVDTMCFRLTVRMNIAFFQLDFYFASPASRWRQSSTDKHALYYPYLVVVSFIELKIGSIPNRQEIWFILSSYIKVNL